MRKLFSCCHWQAAYAILRNCKFRYFTYMRKRVTSIHPNSLCVRPCGVNRTVSCVCSSISLKKRSCHTRRTCCQGNLPAALMNRRTRTVNSAVGRRKTEIKNTRISRRKCASTFTKRRWSLSENSFSGDDYRLF